MHTTFRSTVGTTAVAVLAAGAVAAGPALHSPVAATSFAPVALTALYGPIGKLADTVGLIGNDLFNGVSVFGDYGWEPYQGLLPEFIFTALPIISQVGYNGSAYLGGAVNALSYSVAVLDNAVWNLPSALITAAGQALGGDIPGALTTLYNATVVPVQDAVTAAFGTAAEVVSSVVTNAINVISTIPGIGLGLVNTLVGGAGALVNAVVTIATQTVTALAGLDLETAWNTVVFGLFGPTGYDGLYESSIPGVIESMTIGPGLSPLGYPNGYALPSLRMWGEQSQLQIANALGANYNVPTMAAAVPEPARAARPAAAAAAAAVAVDAGDAGAAQAADAAAARSGESQSADQPDKRSDARRAAGRGR